jgi:hypothetical protein
LADSVDKIVSGLALADAVNRDLSLRARHDAVGAIPLVAKLANTALRGFTPDLASIATDTSITVPVLSRSAAHALIAIPVQT